MKKNNTITVLIVVLLLISVIVSKNVKATEINQVQEVNQVNESINNTTTNSNTSFYSDDITWTWSYEEPAGYMPYGLCTPSTADELEALPVILWLHGSGGATGANGSRYPKPCVAKVFTRRME